MKTMPPPPAKVQAYADTNGLPPTTPSAGENTMLTIVKKASTRHGKTTCNSAPQPAPACTATIPPKRAALVTARNDSGRDGMPFSVREGVPLRAAFDHLSVLIGSSKETLTYFAMASDEIDPEALWSVVHLLEMAFELAEGMHQGVINHDRDVR